MQQFIDTYDFAGKKAIVRSSVVETSKTEQI